MARRWSRRPVPRALLAHTQGARMSTHDPSRRQFIHAASVGAASLALAPAASYARILGANDRVRVGVVGYSDRFRQALLPAFLKHAPEMNFEFVAVSDIWNKRREDGSAFIGSKQGGSTKIDMCRNNDELYA